MPPERSLTDVWRWVAAIVVAAMIAGAPGYIGLLNAPSKEDLDSHIDNLSVQIEVIRDRQQTVLQRLAVVETELANGEADREDLLARISEIRAALESHAQRDGRIAGP